MRAIANDPLPSWNDAPAKQAIVSFVERVISEGGQDYVPPAERIAVFDNDGCLWPENPVPFQFAFIVDDLKRRIATEPHLAADAMIQAALAGDLGQLMADDAYDGLIKVAEVTHAGMTVDEFAVIVNNWLATSSHPRFGKPYDQVCYQPMKEVLRYLRENDFKTFIVSGGGADFMRTWVERVYGIPPEQVVGTTTRTVFELRESGPVLVKTLDHLAVNDGVGKPVGIQQYIGRRPIAAFGNSDGDHAMLQYVTINNPRPCFGLIVHHTDGDREYAYDANPTSTGKLVDALQEAPERGWIVVDMQQDWKQIFDFEPGAVTAIGIVLDPDQTMVEKATAVNARLRVSFPAGFALDAEHQPHITILQRYVRTAELDNVSAAVADVLSREDAAGWQLTAYKNYYLASGPVGLAGIVAAPTAELLSLQRKLIDAVAPYTVSTGTADAFVTTAEDPDIIPDLIDYVAHYVPRSTGSGYNPHVTTGIATCAYLDEMLAEPFEEFTFSPSAAAIYKLGNYGTAKQELAIWPFRS